MHLGYTDISVVATGGPLGGSREAVGPCTAAVDDGRLVARRGNELSVLLCIDDPTMVVGSSVWDRESVLYELVWSVLRGAGVSEQLDVLEIAYPSIWGEERAGIVRATFSASARELVLIETAAAAVASAGERAPSTAVVVEVGALDTSILRYSSAGDSDDDTGAIVPFGFQDSEEWRRATAEHVRAGGDTTEVYVVADTTGPDPVPDHPTRWLSGLDIARALYRRAGADLVPGEHSRNASTRSAAWLDDVAAASPSRGRGIRLPTALVAFATVAVIVCAAVYFSSVAVHSGDIPNVQPSTPAAALESATTTAGVASQTRIVRPDDPDSAAAAQASGASEAATFVLGRVSTRLPATWTRLDDPDRLVLIPPEPPDRRIVVTSAELRPGSTQERVAAELRTAIEARGTNSTIGSLEPARDFGGRVGIAYVERPVDGSTVLWRVFVEDDVQVSIGCQFEDDDSSVIDTECGQATHTLAVEPAS